MSWKFWLTAASLIPIKKPTRMSRASATSLVEPKMLEISLPPRTPPELIHVRPTSMMMASSITVVKRTGPASNKTCFSLNQGTSTPTKRAKATATAAMTPV